jgi:hypothetical protein
VAGSITSIFSNSPAAGIAGGSAAGTAIATLSHTNQVTQKGQYRIRAYATIGTGVTAADSGNMVVTVGSSNYGLPVAAISAGYGPYELFVSLDGNTDVVLKTGANVSGGIYYGSLVAEFLGPMGGLYRR